MRRSLILVLMAGSLLVAACGTSGGDATTTTAAPPAFTSEDLEAILPAASDIGPDYTLEESSDDESGGAAEDEDDDEATTGADEEDPSDKAFEEACPKAQELDLMDDEADENDDEVSVEFSTPRDQGIEVALDPTPGEMDEAKLEELIEAFNDCGTIEYEDPDTGTISMTLSAEPLEDVGDFGADVSLRASLELFGVPIEIDFRGYLFVVDGVGVTVTASGGIDSGTFEATPGEADLLPGLAAEMETRVRSLN
jgi:hypothetical protein